MNANAVLTKRENQIAELIAWGAAKKEIADQLCISERTVENTARSIYSKTEVTKANELSAWYFCTHFNISFALSPVKRQLTAVALLSLIMFSEFMTDDILVRVFRSRARSRTEARFSRARRKSEGDTFEYLPEL